MNNRGIVLLEVLLAIAILSAFGVSAIALVGARLQAETRLRERERELLAAERMLIASSLLSRAELDVRVGMREVQEFAVWVDRPEQSLFRVGIAPADRPGSELLATLVYRPVPVETP